MEWGRAVPFFHQGINRDGWVESLIMKLFITGVEGNKDVKVGSGEKRGGGGGGVGGLPSHSAGGFRHARPTGLLP